MDAFLEFRHIAAGDFFFSSGDGAVFDQQFLPAQERFVHAFAGGLDHRPDGVADGTGMRHPLGLELTLVLAHLGFDDALFGHGAQVADEADFFQNPDRPFGGIELPGFHAVAVVVLKLVVKIVIALAEGEDGHEKAVAGRDFAGIRTLADPMAERVNAKCHVVNDHHAGHAGDEESSKRGDGSAIKPTNERGQAEAHNKSDGDIVFVLPPGELVFLQIAHPGERRFRPLAEEQPADVGVEKSFVDVVGILVVVNMFMVATVVRRPAQRRAFEGRRAEEERVDFHQRTGLESEMREEPMVAEGDAHCGGNREEPKQRDLEEIQSVVPDVERHGGASEREGADEEHAVDEADFAQDFCHSECLEKIGWDWLK